MHKKFLLITFFLIIISIYFEPIYTYSVTINKWELNLFGSKILKYEDDDFGGISGLTISKNGENFVMISDKSFFFKGKIIRDNLNKITDLKILEKGKLSSSKGEILTGKNIDSESIVKINRNGYYISFESNNRIMYHETLKSPGKFMPKHSDFNKLLFNDGIEALAIKENGELYAIPELPPNGKDYHPIYKFNNNEWSIIDEIKIDQGFKVVDAEMIDDKNLITLERKFSFYDGFKIRLRRIIFEKNNIKNSEILLESLPWEYYNFEGLSKWKDSNGKIYLTLISDNQFSPLLKTEVREFILNK
ncbi:MAG: esterase-like activity of phytase family protein [Paracoccaceae bacterium]